MAGEEASDQLSVPGPMVVRVGGSVDGKDSTSACHELLQRFTPIVDQPFRGGVLWIGRRAEEHDGAKPPEALCGEDPLGPRW